MNKSFIEYGKRTMFQRCFRFLFHECKFGNLHWLWDNRVCYCGHHEHNSIWHGGVSVDGIEMIPYDNIPSVLEKVLEQDWKIRRESKLTC